MYWFTSDLHFGHHNIINKCHRPYDDLEEMHADIIQKWNRKVKHKDTVFFLGDFALGIKPEKIASILYELKGKIRIIEGNHDKPLRKAINRYQPKNVKILPPLYEWHHNKQTYVMCHYPLYSWNKMHYKDGSLHLHGHAHGKDPVTKVELFSSPYTNSKHVYRIDVGWDGHYDLWSLDDILNEIH